MSFLGRLLRREKQQEAPAVPDSKMCPHIALTARWANADDIGNESKATGFDCSACGESFSPEEAERVRSEAGERLQADLG